MSILARGGDAPEPGFGTVVVDFATQHPLAAVITAWLLVYQLPVSIFSRNVRLGWWTLNCMAAAVLFIAWGSPAVVGAGATLAYVPAACLCTLMALITAVRGARQRRVRERDRARVR
jgi:hypothetical protein